MDIEDFKDKALELFKKAVPVFAVCGILALPKTIGYASYKWEKYKKSKERKEITLSNDEMRTLENLNVAKWLIAHKMNTLGQFDKAGLEEYKFSGHDISLLQQTAFDRKVAKTAIQTTKAGKPRRGQQTYCYREAADMYRDLGYTDMPRANGNGAASNAIPKLRKEDEWLELHYEKTDDLTNLRITGMMVRGKGNTKYGHASTLVPLPLLKELGWKAPGHIKNKSGIIEMGDYAYDFPSGRSDGKSYDGLYMFILWEKVQAKPELMYKFASLDMLSPRVKAAVLEKIQTDKSFDYSLAANLKNGEKTIAFSQAVENYKHAVEQRKVASIEANKEKYRREQQKLARNNANKKATAAAARQQKLAANVQKRGR